MAHRNIVIASPDPIKYGSRPRSFCRARSLVVFATPSSAAPAPRLRVSRRLSSSPPPPRLLLAITTTATTGRRPLVAIAILGIFTFALGFLSPKWNRVVEFQEVYLKNQEMERLQASGIALIRSDPKNLILAVSVRLFLHQFRPHLGGGQPFLGPCRPNVSNIGTREGMFSAILHIPRYA
ncbi:hypothetical protein DFH07DRAFT_11808 [Mycena maculata]|uniref:Uncharacterized protein n=1 Tax=Mycena maculata TaxID=230809 RepID=A0AAD7K3K9_9AGAR|nr:hypothetical protein DFH07DRAFT_11808 [Mycena maculata]